MPAHWKVTPGSRVDVRAIDPASTPGKHGGEKAVAKELPALRETLAGWQEKLWAESRRSLLVVLQALDAGGKDGTIKHVFLGVNPQGVRVVPFKAPTPVEQSHDFLWRVHAECPRAGEMVVFNRSHYEDVLAARVRGGLDARVCRERYEHINHFEALLAHGGTTLVKFFLHISKDEQRERFEARLADATKRWKFRAGDLDDRALWDDYQHAYNETLSHTSTETAPWHVIPADHKWYRNWAVSQVLNATLEAMAPDYPDVDPGPVVIR
jgi:PPK2 family polyphosphate:nucleotide phosphotransferase